ncbi:hypothetical protein E8E11_008055 [Didymella keratinophila]|nr:hypothetical protein E8E11_008055 [Didymella keratinophila]
MPPMDSKTKEAQSFSRVGARITNTETKRVVLEGDGPEAAEFASEDGQSPAQQADPIDGYDTEEEEEELRRRSSRHMDTE